MRKVNEPLLVWTIAGAIVLGGAIHLVHGVQVARSSRGLRKQAENAARQGLIQRSERCYRLYLDHQTGDIDALAEYGMLLQRQTNSPASGSRAAAAFEKVLRLKPGRRQVRRHLVDVSRRLGRNREAVYHLKILLKGSPGDGEIEEEIGACREAEGEYVEAADWYEKATTHAPGRVEPYRRLASLYRRRLDSPGRGDGVIDRLAEKNPNDFEAHLARGVYRKAFGLAGAAEDIARAQALAPDDLDVVVAQADIDRAAGRFDAARQLLRRALSRTPKILRLYTALAELELQAGRPDAVVACFETGLNQLPDQTELLLGLADAEVRAGRLAEARSTLGALREKDVAPPLLDLLEGQILARDRQWGGAARIARRVAPLLHADPGLAKQAYLLQSVCQEHLGDVDARLDACRRALEIDPQWQPARLGLASALRASGRLAEAAAEYRSLGRLEFTTDAALALARLLIERNLGRPAPLRDVSEAERTLQTAEQGGADPVKVAILRAEIAVARDQPDQATTLLEAARAAHPRRVEPWIALSALAERRGDRAGALDLLKLAGEKLGLGPELRLATLRYWTSDPDDAEARTRVAAIAEALASAPIEIRSRLLLEIAEFAEQTGDVTGARRSWTRMAEQEPERLTPRLHLFDLAAVAGDEPGMEENLRAIRRAEDPDAAYGLVAEARLLLARARRGDRAGLETARARLAVARERRPAWGQISLVRAEIAELEGDRNAAIDAYLQAAERGVHPPALVRRAAFLLYDRQRYAEADLLIQAMKEQDALPADLNSLAAEISLRLNDPDRALRLARSAVPDRSPDFRDHLWLGQLLAASGKAEDAEKAFRHAVEIAREAPEPRVALVRFLVGVRRRSDAESEVARVARSLPAARVPLTLALCHEALGHFDQAETSYREALKAAGNDPTVLRGAANYYAGRANFLAAEPLLRTLLAPSVEATEGDRAWARRNLALGLGTRDPSHYEEALALVAQNLRANGGTTADERARIAIMATRPEHRDEAIRTLERLIDRDAPDPAEQLLLAQLYLADHDWLKARLTLLSLLSTTPNALRPLTLLIRHLIVHGELDEARRRLTTLETLEPGADPTLELKARLLAAQGEGARAGELLSARARDEYAPLDAIAPLLEELGQFAAAETVYRASAARPNDPVRTLSLAGFLGRRGRANEALDLCDQTWSTCPPALTASFCLSVLTSARPDGALFRRVSDRLEREIQNHPDAPELRSHLANLRTLEGRYQDAQAGLRAIIAADGRDFVAMNNLAWLLVMKEGRPKDALELIGRAVQVAGPLPGLLDTRAVAYLALGRIDDAIRDLTEATSRQQSPTLYFHLARAHHLSNDRSSAIDALRRALAAGLTPDRLHPLELPAYNHLLADLKPAAVSPPLARKP